MPATPSSPCCWWRHTWELERRCHWGTPFCSSVHATPRQLQHQSHGTRSYQTCRMKFGSASSASSGATRSGATWRPSQASLHRAFSLALGLRCTLRRSLPYHAMAHLHTAHHTIPWPTVLLYRSLPYPVLLRVPYHATFFILQKHFNAASWLRWE